MRRKRSNKHKPALDLRYENPLIGRFINNLMKEGKKSVAQRVMYEALALFEKETKTDNVVGAFESAVQNVMPAIEVKSRRVGGATYQVPREVRGERQIALAIRWLIDASRAKKGKPMAVRLAEELVLATKKEGTAIKKKMDTLKMAEANKAFAHFSW